MGSVLDTGNKASATIIADVFSNLSKLEAAASVIWRFHFQNGIYTIHQENLHISND